MAGVNQFIIDKLPECVSSKPTLYLTPQIPEKALAKAVKSFDFDGEPSSILAFVDGSGLGMTSGIVFSGQRLVYKSSWGKPISINFSDIRKVNVEQVQDDKGRLKRHLKISSNEGVTSIITDAEEFDYEKMASFLNNLATDFESYEEQNQLLPIDQLHEELKKAYVKTIINMVYSDDGEIDSKEFSEVMMLMTRIDLVSDARKNVRNYLSSLENSTPVSELISIIDQHTPDGMKKSVHISLVKDIISVHASTKNEVTANIEFLKTNQGLLNVSHAEVDLAISAIKEDRKILDRQYTDDQITKGLKELSAKAAAVGVPLGAIYLSGSVVGMSAAGMTSGLATLGAGGVLGLSSMATGIGAVVIMGVVAYRGVKYLTNTGTEEGDKRREIMLQNVVRLNQKTISLVIEDINELVDELNSAIQKGLSTEEVIKALSAKLQIFIRASQEISNKNLRDTASQARLSCPEYLDIERLKVVSGGNLDRDVYDFVLSHYEEVTLSAKDGKESERKAMQLKQNLNTEQLAKLGEIFDSLKYSETASAVKGKAESIKNNVSEKAKKNLGNFFAK